MKKIKRFLSMLLVLCLVLGFLPGTAFATNSTHPFTDVSDTAWYSSAVQYVYEHGMMTGTNSAGTEFSPDSSTSRGMIVTILHRLEGTPSASGMAFTDVPDGQWYTDAVAWASANDIMGGYGGGLFGPNDPITREQLATTMYRYAKHKGYDTTITGNVAAFSDGGTVSSYAADAINWAIGVVLFNGVGNNMFAPKGGATRAQTATILMRFCENVVSSDEGIAKYHTVTFEYNYGSKGTYNTATVEHGKTVTSPTNPTRSGYTFSGWYTSASGGSKFDFSTDITSDLTLYAHWRNISSNSSGSPTVYYQVTFDVQAADANYTPAAQQVRAGDKVTKPETPTRPGYGFDYWYIDNEEEEYDFDTPVSNSITLHAKWTRSDIVNPDDGADSTLRVTFDYNDGTNRIYDVQDMVEGEKVTKPATDPSREDYGFTGWYTEPGTATEYNFDTEVGSSFTLYAGWGNPDGSEGLYSAGSGGRGIEPAITGIEIGYVDAESQTGLQQVTATVSTPNTSMLLVEFLNEDEFWAAPAGTEDNLDEIVAIATPTPSYCELEPVSIILTDDVMNDLPEHFVVRASLLDNEGAPVMVPGAEGEEVPQPVVYYTIQYTSIYAEFENRTIEDIEEKYGEEHVILFDKEGENYGVFAEDVIIVDQANGKNVLTVTTTFANDDDIFPSAITYTFSNPDTTVSALKIGDKVYALDEDGYPQLFMVGGISPEGVITAADAALTDFYTVLKADMEGDAPAETDIQPLLEVIDVNTTLSKSIGGSISWKPKDWLKVNGSLSGTASLKIKMAWDAHLFSKDYFECSVTAKVEVALEVDLEAEGSKDFLKKNPFEGKWPSARVDIPTSIPGLTVYIDSSLPLELTLTGKAGLKLSASLEAGFSYDTISKFQTSGKASYKNTLGLEAEVELKTGPKVAMGVAFLKNVVKSEASVQAGVKISASEFVGGEWTSEDDSKHACTFCLDGDAEWFKEAKASLSYEITKKLSASYNKTIYKAEVKIGFGGKEPGQFYISIAHGDDHVFKNSDGSSKGIVFGAGKCPNQTWKTTFKTEDADGNEVAGIGLNVVRKDGTTNKTGTTEFTEYLHNGVYTATGTINGTEVKKSFTVNEAKQTVTLSPASGDHTLSGIVTDADTHGTLEDVNVSVVQDNLTVASVKTSATGIYSLRLPEGTYQLVASKEGYVTSITHVAVPSDRDVYQNVEMTRGEDGMGGFSGRIVDSSTGSGIGGVTLELRAGWNASTEGTMVMWDSTTAADGTYEYVKPTVFGHALGLDAGNYTITASKEGYETKSFNITVLPDVANNRHQDEPLSRQIEVASGNYRIVLTWGEHPRDLDSHLIGALSNGSTYHVYFGNKQQYEDGALICDLDVDDTTSYGPETVTLTLTTDKPYYYYIHKFAGEGDIAHSNAHIEVYDENGLVDSFNAPTNQGSGNYWNVFAIVNGRLVINNTITDSPNTSYAGEVGVVSLSLTDDLMDKDPIPADAA